MLQLDLSWRGLDEEFARIEAELAATARGITVSAWGSILRRTPQWSGAMAASWTYSIGAPVTVDRSHLVDEPETTSKYNMDGDETIEGHNTRWAGHSAAIAVANQHSYGADTLFKLGDVVYIGNGVTGGVQGYSAQVEDGSFRLRGVNMPGRPVYLTLAALRAKYGQGVSRAAAGQLKNLKIGF